MFHFFGHHQLWDYKGYSVRPFLQIDVNSLLGLDIRGAISPIISF